MPNLVLRIVTYGGARRTARTVELEPFSSIELEIGRTVYRVKGYGESGLEIRMTEPMGQQLWTRSPAGNVIAILPEGV